MMKQFLTTILCLTSITTCMAADLIDVFQEALVSDPQYQSAIAKALAVEEDVTIDRSLLLPEINLIARPQIVNQMNEGSVTHNFLPPNNMLRNMDIKLQVTQPIFNMQRFAMLQTAKATAKQACAKLNADLQDLMLRVAKAYFTILEDEEKVTFYKSSKITLERQLYQAKQKFKMGSKTKTDVYAAQSAYGSAQSNLITAETQLTIDREFLRTMTAQYYANLSKLNTIIPIVSPDPNNMDEWVSTALQQNWTIKSTEFAVLAAREKIRQGYAGHYPKVDAEVFYEIQDNFAARGGTLVAAGSSKTRDKVALLNIEVPIFASGRVVSRTQQLKYDYEIAQQELERHMRNTAYTVRQNYLAIKANIQKIHDDNITIQSAKHSLYGLQERYKIGSETLIDLLNQQEKVVEAELRYSKDRYAYILNLLELKKAAGTLCVQDLAAVNAWLKH